jgi:uncharacterized protein (DUF433 family)
VQLEDYFEFETFDSKFGPIERIRIKEHRIAIENVIEYFNQGMEPGQIAREIYPTLSLEQVYATITYYLHNKAEVEAYIQRGERIADAWYQEYLKYGPFFLRDRAGEYTTPPPSDVPAHE